MFLICLWRIRVIYFPGVVLQVALKRDRIIPEWLTWAILAKAGSWDGCVKFELCSCRRQEDTVYYLSQNKVFPGTIKQRQTSNVINRQVKMDMNTVQHTHKVSEGFIRKFNGLCWISIWTFALKAITRYRVHHVSELHKIWWTIRRL